jgi:hypothetical protein
MGSAWTMGNVIVAFPPGFLIAEHRSGIGDWQIDEAWDFSWQVCGWNTLAWALLGTALTPLVALWTVIRRTRN